MSMYHTPSVVNSNKKPHEDIYIHCIEEAKCPREGCPNVIGGYHPTHPGYCVSCYKKEEAPKENATKENHIIIDILNSANSHEVLNLTNYLLSLNTLYINVVISDMWDNCPGLSKPQLPMYNGTCNTRKTVHWVATGQVVPKIPSKPSLITGASS